MRAAQPHTRMNIERGDARLHCEIYGQGARTILFVPTWSLIHSRGWKAQVPYFSDRFRVITFDPRGNGRSSRPDRPDAYALDRVIEDVPAVLDATDTAEAILVGHSFSSAVAFAVAARYPDRVAAVVSICAWSPIVPPFRERQEAFEAGPVENPQGWQKHNGDYWLRNYPDFLAFFLGKVHSEPHSTKQLEDAISWALEGDGAMLKMTQEARDSDFAITEEMYESTRCPALIVVGDADQITPPETSYRIAELTGGELHVFEGGGHGVHARYPARFNLLMRDFLARHLGTWQPGKGPTSEAGHAT